VREFAASWQERLEALRQSLLMGGWMPRGFTRFVIHEPKERTIHAPCFEDRVIHHALVDAAMGDFERWMVDDTYACRRGRGHAAAVRRAEEHARRHGWFLKLDVRKYFDSIPHVELMSALERRFRNQGVQELWRRIVMGYEANPGRGIPIGSLTSQMLGNFYLMGVDRACLEEMRVGGYVRYMDDMALWGAKDLLERAKDVVVARLEGLGLELKGNWHLQPTWRGMEFLGLRVYPDGCLLSRRSRRRMIRKWRTGQALWADGELGDAAWQRSLTALISRVRLAKKERIVGRLREEPGFVAIGLQPCEPRRQLEQRRQERALGQAEQERPGQPEQQPGLPPRPQLTSGSLPD
jgi:RNA-directed DNA polymerase